MTGPMGRRIAAEPRVSAPSPQRLAAFRRGLSAETRAAIVLRLKGYRILARRWHTAVGEIDIVAMRRGLLAFIEVKARASLDDAAEAVTERQRRRIAAAAQAWLAGHREHANAEIRLDAMRVA